MPHAQYPALASDEPSRRAAYRQLYRNQLDPGLIDQIRQVTNGNFALGNGRFKEQIAAALGRRVRPGSAGRPRRRSQKVADEPT